MKRDSITLQTLLANSVERDRAKERSLFIDRDLSRIVDEAIEILREDSNLFARAGSLVRVRRTGNHESAIV